MNRNTLDPLQAARDFTRNPHPRRQFLGLAQRLAAVERRASRLANEAGGGGEGEAAAVAQVDGTPEITEDDVGTFFLSRNADAEDAISVAIAAADGSPILVTLGSGANPGWRWRLLVAGLASDIIGVAVDASRNIYISLESGDLKKYNASLALQWTQTLAGGGHVATDGTSVFVASAANHTVYKRLASTGAAGSPATIGSSGTGNGQLAGPIGVATDGATLWVVDSGNGRVQKFSAGTGAYSAQYNGSSSGLAFNRPTGITLLTISGVAIILDTGNARAPGFNMATDSYAGGPQFSFGNGDGQISEEAEGVAIANDGGRIWIGDTGNHRVMVNEAAGGAFKARIAGYGSGDAQFKFPRQVAIDADGVVYVADGKNRRLVTVRENAAITPAITRRSNSVSVGNTSTGTVTSTCNADEVCISCGVEFAAGPARWVGDAYVTTANGCYVSGRNNSTGGALTLWAHAMCMKVPLS